MRVATNGMRHFLSGYGGPEGGLAQIGPMSKQTIPFSRQERLVRKVADSVASLSLLHPLPMCLGRGVLSINFDDFPRTAWTEGGAVLASFGLKATYFVAGGLRGCCFDGVQQFEANDLEEVYGAGHEIGCHTYDHFAAPRCSPESFLASVERNRRFLAELLPGLRAESFAYPYGLKTVRLRKLLAGSFTSQRDTSQASNGPFLDRSRVRTFGLEQWRTEKIGAHDSYFDAVFAAAAQNRYWVIVATHEVCERPGLYGCTPDQLHRVVSLALSHGLDVATNAEVMRRIFHGCG